MFGRTHGLRFGAAAVMGMAAMGFSANQAEGAELLVELLGGSLTNTGSLGDASFLGDTAFGEGLSGAGAGYDNVEAGGIAITDGGSALSGLQSMTISMFVKTDVGLPGTPGTPNQDQFFFSDEGSGSEYNRVRARTNERLEWHLVGEDASVTASSSADPSYANITDEWFFIAITADSASGVNFYVGTESSGVMVLEQARPNSSGWGLLQGAGDLIFGNSKFLTRGFLGSMDNIRMHGSYDDGSGALSAGELNSLFQAGLADIPEPGTAMLVAAGGALLLGRRRQAAE